MTRIHRICYRTQTHTVGTVKVRKKCTVLHCGFVGKHTFCIGVTLQQNGPLQAHDVGVLSLARSLSHSLSLSLSRSLSLSLFCGVGCFFFLTIKFWWLCLTSSLSSPACGKMFKQQAESYRVHHWLSLSHSLTQTIQKDMSQSTVEQSKMGWLVSYLVLWAQSTTKDYIRAEHKLHSVSQLLISQVILPQVMFFFSLFIFRGHSTREPACNRMTYFILRAYTGTGVSQSQHRKKQQQLGEVLEKMQGNGPVR